MNICQVTLIDAAKFEAYAALVDAQAVLYEEVDGGDFSLACQLDTDPDPILT